ncbi:DUF6954 family protein [Bacillus sp. DJP31]|uniref:DUF6954 family protein n=1 Tax=Bacillus sp. DJP31 TaxID=3409789 RepID=UPI003BB71B41
MKWFMIGFFSILYLLITFFGLGPVLMADGSMQERVITLAVVVLLYVVLSIVFRSLLKNSNNPLHSFESFGKIKIR